MLQIEGNTVRERFISAVEGLKMKFPGAMISKATGYHKGTVSAYLNDLEPSEAFLKTFCQQFDIDFDLIWTGQPKTTANDETEASKEKPGSIDYQAKFYDAYETIKGYNGFLQRIVESSLVGISDKQEGGFAIVIELLKRDALREAAGNQGRADKILADILRRIGPDLSQKMKEGIRADGHS